MEAFIQCASSFVASYGFTLIFRIHHHPKFAILGSTISAITWFTYLSAGFLHSSVSQTFIAAVVTALLSELVARKQKAPATIFLIIGCFPLVPGKGIYESMLYAVQGNTDAFLQALVHTFSISIAIALAILIVSTLFKIIKKQTTRNRRSIQG